MWTPSYNSTVTTPEELRFSWGEGLQGSDLYRAAESLHFHQHRSGPFHLHCHCAADPSTRVPVAQKQGTGIRYCCKAFLTHRKHPNLL